jgi:hypothetical protein
MTASGSAGVLAVSLLLRVSICKGLAIDRQAALAVDASRPYTSKPYLCTSQALEALTRKPHQYHKLLDHLHQGTLISQAPEALTSRVTTSNIFYDFGMDWSCILSPVTQALDKWGNCSRHECILTTLRNTHVEIVNLNQCTHHHKVSGLPGRGSPAERDGPVHHGSGHSQSKDHPE